MNYIAGQFCLSGISISGQACDLVQRKDRPWHVPVWQAFIVQRAKSAAIADDNLPGDGFKSGAKMLHRLERDDAFAFGLDAERFELLQVEHLLWQS